MWEEHRERVRAVVLQLCAQPQRCIKLDENLAKSPPSYVSGCRENRGLSRAIISGSRCTALLRLQPAMKPLFFLMRAAACVLTAYPIIREAVVCVERGLRQVNNPQPF